LIAANTWAGITTPLGLFGDTVTMARVRGVIAAANLSGSGIRPACTGTGTAPASCTAITWLK
jgi:hypothetical protein